MYHGPPLNWDDIAGLEFAKTVIKEIVVWPMLRPYVMISTFCLSIGSTARRYVHWTYLCVMDSMAKSGFWGYLFVN